MCNSLDLRTGERTWQGRPEDLAGSKEEKGLGRGCKSNASHSPSTAVARALGEMQMLNGACDCISEGPQVMRTLGTPAGPRHGFDFQFIVKDRKFQARKRQEKIQVQGQSCWHLRKAQRQGD